MDAKVTHLGIFDMQVCVPMEWTDKDVLTFAEKEYPSGTDGGWEIRKEGDPALSEDSERVPCDDRSGCVHIMLDA